MAAHNCAIPDGDVPDAIEAVNGVTGATLPDIVGELVVGFYQTMTKAGKPDTAILYKDSICKD